MRFISNTLGVAAGIGVAVGWWACVELIRLNALTGHPRDIFVLFLYLAVIFALVGGVGGILFSLVFSRPLRRRFSPRGIAAVGSLGALVFMDLFSRVYVSHQFIDLRNAHLVYTFEKSLGIALALLLAALLGAALVVRIVSRIPLRTGRLLVRLAAAGAALTLLVFGVLPDRHEARDASPYYKTEGHKVLLLLADSATWDAVNPLRAAGRLPNWSDLLDEGWGARMSVDHPALSPRLWNTIATGKRPRDHGVTDFMNLKLAGMTRPLSNYPFYGSTTRLWIRTIFNGLDRLKLTQVLVLSSQQRTAAALWNILDRVEGRACVLNWWAAAPPEHLEYGIVVAPHPDKPESWWPAELHGTLGQLESGLTAETFATLLGDPTAGAAAPADLSPRARNKYDKLRRIADRDLRWTAICERILRDGQPDLMMLGLRGLDSVSHLFYLERQLARRGAAESADDLGPYFGRYTSPEEVALFHPVIDGFYKLYDEILGRLLAVIEPGTIVVVVSDHGFLFDGDNHLPSAPPGLFIVSTRRPDGSAPANASIYDVCPTVLALLGLPPAADMPGRDLSQSQLTEGLVPLQPIVSYGQRDSGLPDVQMDEEERERLRALGYIK